MKQTLRFFSALMILTMACILPAPSTDAPLPAPTADTRLENMVALTVSSALEMTQQAIPTQTPVPTRTAQPTVTSTPEALAVESTLSKDEDGAIVFVDELAKYQITISSELMALRINQQEFLDAWLLPEASNSAIQNQLSTIQDQDPDRFRLFALDFNEEHIESGFVTNINFLWDDVSNLSIEESLLQAKDDYLEIFPDVEIVENNEVVLQNEISVGLLMFKNKVTTLENVEIVVFQKQAFLLLPKGILMITLSGAESQIEFIEPLFDEMLESFRLIEES
jgi:hypothetical protein